MTWLGDNRDKAKGVEREKLLESRAILIRKIETLKSSPILTKTEAAKRFRQEDLLALAKEVIKIDEKLGRSPA